jgi:hypothetical protein
MRDTLSGRARVRYGDMSESEARELLATCQAFLDGSTDIDALPLDTVKLIKETLARCRTLYQALRMARDEDAGGALAGGQAVAAGAPGDALGLMESRGVGSMEPATGFALGTAPTAARPQWQALEISADVAAGAEAAIPLPCSPSRVTSRSSVSRGHAESELALALGCAVTAAAGAAGARPAAFEAFKVTTAAGRAAAATLKATQMQQRDSFLEQRQLGSEARPLVPSCCPHP